MKSKMASNLCKCLFKLSDGRRVSEISPRLPQNVIVNLYVTDKGFEKNILETVMLIDKLKNKVHFHRLSVITMVIYMFMNGMLQFKIRNVNCFYLRNNVFKCEIIYLRNY